MKNWDIKFFLLYICINNSKDSVLNQSQYRLYFKCGDYFIRLRAVLTEQKIFFNWNDRSYNRAVVFF